MQKSLKKNCNWPLTLFILHISINSVTGKYLSEALIFASTNPQFDNTPFNWLQVQYMKIAILCTQIVGFFCFDIQNNLYTQHVLNSDRPGVTMHPAQPDQ